MNRKKSTFVTRLAAAVAAAALTAGIGAGVAAADGNYPYHQSGKVTLCLSSAVGPIVWGNASMYGTPGYQDVVNVGSGLYGNNVTYGVRYQPQWLIYRLWASYYDGAGRIQWVKGKAIARQKELGDFTAGNDTLFEISPGKWVTTGWIGSGAPADVSVLALPFRNVSYRITAEYYWGPVYDWNNNLSYAGASHFEDKGIVRC